MSLGIKTDKYVRAHRFTKGRYLVFITTSNNKTTVYNSHETSNSKLKHLIKQAEEKGFRVQYKLNDPNYLY